MLRLGEGNISMKIAGFKSDVLCRLDVGQTVGLYSKCRYVVGGGRWPDV